MTHMDWVVVFTTSFLALASFVYALYCRSWAQQWRSMYNEEADNRATAERSREKEVVFSSKLWSANAELEKQLSRLRTSNRIAEDVAFRLAAEDYKEPFVVKLPRTDPSLTYDVNFNTKLDCSLHLFTRAPYPLSRLDCRFLDQANGVVRLYVGSMSPKHAAMFLVACGELSAAVAAYRAHWGVRTLRVVDSASVKRFMYAEALAEEAKRDEGQDVALLLSDERAKNATLHDRIKELEEWQRGVIRTNVLEYADRCSCPRCELIRKLRKDAHLDE